MSNRPGALSPPLAPQLGPVEWAMLLALSLLWGGSFLFAKVAVAEVPPLTLVFARVALAAAVLHIVVRLMRHGMGVGARLWAAFLVMGLLNNVIPFSLIFWGQQQIGAGLASILNATTPLFTVLVAQAFTRDEKASAARIAGVVIGLGGVAAMVGTDALAGLDASIVAQLACVGAAISYAFAGVFGRRFKAVPPIVTACGQLSASTLIMLPVALSPVLASGFSGAWPALPSTTAIGAILALALLSTALAYILFFRILATAGATNLLLVTFLIPVSAILLGVLLLGEALLPRHFVGMAAIAVGLACIDGRPLRWLSRRAAAR